MPVLFIANATKQAHNFAYRLPEKDRVFRQKIEIGGQISIALSNPEIDWVLKQHQVYGMTAVKEVKNQKGFSGLCYSIDKAIDVDSILNAVDVKDEVITERSLEHRKNAAASIEDSVSKQAQEMGIEAGNTQVEIEEQKTGPADNDVKFKETIEVTSEKRRGRPRNQG